MADVLVHLVDASNPMWRKQVRARAPVSMYICPCEDTPLCIYIYARVKTPPCPRIQTRTRSHTHIRTTTTPGRH